MQPQSSTDDYRQILIRELSDRQSRNPRYSLRAFARDLGLSASMLSDVLKAKHGLSRAKAKRVAEGLELKARDREYFCDLVESREARSESARLAANARLLRYQSSSAFAQISQDSFRFIADWYHTAIIAMADAKNFRWEARAISKQLRISETEARDALDRLLRLGLISKSPEGMRVHSDLFAVASDVPSRAIRGLHEQVLRKAITALQEQPLSTREFGSNFVAIDAADVEYIKARIKEFQMDLINYVSKSKTKNQLAALSIQFFKICDVKELH